MANGFGDMHRMIEGSRCLGGGYGHIWDKGVC
jgi:hypothetical protein